jgi:hypothetical protein
MQNETMICHERRCRAEAMQRAMHRLNQTSELIDTNSIFCDVTPDDTRNQVAINGVRGVFLGHLHRPSASRSSSCSRQQFIWQLPKNVLVANRNESQPHRCQPLAPVLRLDVPGFFCINRGGRRLLCDPRCIIRGALDPQRGK